MRRLAVYCGSASPADPIYIETARLVGRTLAERGIGVVYGKSDVLAHMPPWQGGGNMIADVTFEKTLYNAPPERFEAGTGNIADAVGLGAAIDYVEAIGMDVIARYEHELLVYATGRMQTVPGLKRASAAGLTSEGAGSGSEDGGLVDAGVTVSVVVRLTPP